MKKNRLDKRDTVDGMAICGAVIEACAEHVKVKQRKARSARADSESDTDVR